MDGKKAFSALQPVSYCPTPSWSGRRAHIPRPRDPAYEKALRANVAEVLEDRSHPVAPLLNKKVIEDTIARPLGNASSFLDRSGLERALSIGTSAHRLGPPGSE